MVGNGSRIIRPIDGYRHSSRRLRRYLCQDCGRSFCLRRQRKKRYSEQFAREVVRSHVEGRMSFRVLAKRYRETLGVRISPSSLQRMVFRLGLRCKTPGEISAELDLGMWRGYLITDDKHVAVSGGTMPWYLGLDSGGDILHAEVMPHPTVGSMVAFFEAIRDGCHYRVRGLTSDQEQLFFLAFRRVWPEKPHQYCLKHALDQLDRLLGYHRLQNRRRALQARLRAIVQAYPERAQRRSQLRTRHDLTRGVEQLRAIRESLEPLEDLRAAIRRVLFSRSYELARARWAAFCRHGLRRQGAHRTIIEYVGKHWQSLTVHYHYRTMPATNNIAERTMAELERRLKTIGSFGNARTAEAYINLLIAYLRTKPYTDCRGRRRYCNGLSRLELAGAELHTKDWVKLALKP